MPAPPSPQTPFPDSQGLGSAMQDLTDRMYGSATYTEAAAALEEVLDPHNGLLPRLQEFFQAAAERAQPFGLGEGRVPAMGEWQVRDSFAFAARQVGDMVVDFDGIANEVRAMEPHAPGWNPGVAVTRSTAVQHASGPRAEPPLAPGPLPTAQPEGPVRRAR